MIVAQALARAVQTLKSANVPDASNDARILLAFSLGIDRMRLTLVLHDEMTSEAQEAFDFAISQRAKRKPVSQIIGMRAFYGRDFKVTSDVLDPRPDTELLIETALETEFKAVLDIGTGSGCILLTLMAERPQCVGMGSDISSQALSVAQDNAKAVLGDRSINFVQSDWFADIPDQKLDLIVSNPPYISADEMLELDRDVFDWEPKIALTPGGDGLEPYRILTKKAPRYLNSQGRLIVEIGHLQGRDVAELFKEAGFENIAVSKDLNGKDRAVHGLWV